MPQWIRIQGKNAEGWLGIEGKDIGRGDYDWFYSKSDEKVSISSWDKRFDASNGSCVYLKGKKGKWIVDSCGEVHSFICEFRGKFFPRLGTI